MPENKACTMAFVGLRRKKALFTAFCAQNAHIFG
jgi:hypothetical protein